MLFKVCVLSLAFSSIAFSFCGERLEFEGFHRVPTERLSLSERKVREMRVARYLREKWDIYKEYLRYYHEQIQPLLVDPNGEPVSDIEKVLSNAQPKAEAQLLTFAFQDQKRLRRLGISPQRMRPAHIQTMISGYGELISLYERLKHDEVPNAGPLAFDESPLEHIERLSKRERIPVEIRLVFKEYVEALKDNGVLPTPSALTAISILGDEFFAIDPSVN